jgi:hypothetical protein
MQIAWLAKIWFIVFIHSFIFWIWNKYWLKSIVKQCTTILLYMSCTMYSENIGIFADHKHGSHQWIWRLAFNIVWFVNFFFALYQGNRKDSSQHAMWIKFKTRWEGLLHGTSTISVLTWDPSQNCLKGVTEGTGYRKA